MSARHCTPLNPRRKEALQQRDGRQGFGAVAQGDSEDSASGAADRQRFDELRLLALRSDIGLSRCVDATGLPIYVVRKSAMSRDDLRTLDEVEASASRATGKRIGGAT